MKTILRSAVWLIGASVWVSSVRAADLVERVPAGALLYVGWPGIDSLSETAKDTELAKLMKEPEVVRFRETWRELVWPAIKKQISKESDAPPELTDMVTSMMSIIWKHPTAVSFVGVSMGGGMPDVDVAIYVRAGADGPALMEFADKMAAMAGQQGGDTLKPQVTEVEVGGAKFKQTLLHGVVGMSYGVTDGDFIIMVGRKTLEHLKSAAAAGSLAQSERFKAAMKATGGSAATPVVYVDLRGVAETLEQFQPLFASEHVPVLGDEGGVKKLLEGLGLGTIQSFSIACVPEAGGFKSTFHLHAPGLGKGVSRLLIQKPLTDDDLKIIPKDASWMSASNFDIAGLYKGALESVQTLSPPVHEQIMQAIDQVEKTIGLKIAEDLLGTFGDTWMIFDAPSNGTFVFTGVTIVAEVKPDNKLETAMQTLIGFIAGLTGEENALELKSEDYRGQKIHYANTKGVPMPIAPAWAQYEGKWIVALYPQMVRIALDRLLDKGESLLANEDYQRGRKLLPKEVTAISYADTRAGMRTLYSLALPITQAVVAMGQGEKVPADPTMMPAWPTVARHLFGDVSSTSSNEEGVTTVYHGVLPLGLSGTGAMGGIIGASMGTSILLPSLARARELSKRTVSTAKLAAIGKAMYTYSTEHQDKFPPDLKTLVDEKLIMPAEALVSPHDAPGATCSFVYLAGQSADDDPRNIVAYEKLEIGDGEGTSVLYVDSHVEWHNLERFERELEETKERLKKKGIEVESK